MSSLSLEVFKQGLGVLLDYLEVSVLAEDLLSLSLAEREWSSGF